jgi:Cu(I)/Ag(I) efflux system protein CusF
MNKLLQGSVVVALGASSVAFAQSAGVTDKHSHDHPASPPAAAATAPAPQTDGEIRKVDVANQKLTVKHGPIENLGMSSMTMVFRVKDPSFLTQVKPGDKVKMRVESVDGALTIVALQTQP